MSTLVAHANAERAFSEHRKRGCNVPAELCQEKAARDELYAVYTKTPHPSTLGRGGSL